jgi:hypothetical protein
VWTAAACLHRVPMAGIGLDDTGGRRHRSVPLLGCWDFSNAEYGRQPRRLEAVPTRASTRGAGACNENGWGGPATGAAKPDR